MSDNFQRLQAQKGVSFRTDLAAVGTARSGSRLGALGVSGTNVIDEEKRVIDKVFSIVDKDHSGIVDPAELKDMFKLFGVADQSLNEAITRIMSNVDKDHSGGISPEEFYLLLSQKFERGDPKSDIQAVFNRMDRNHDGKLDVQELHEVAKQLGENLKLDEIKDMIKMFSTDYQRRYKDWEKNGKPNNAPAPQPDSITFEDFYNVMQEDLA
mmetsp:Transcript_56201/g.162854  ORF Transcript_56201/g.162854 Transcript_56201/m.162854 type:complete len:211 (+) Transcript_56201:85-717(+)